MSTPATPAHRRVPLPEGTYDQAFRRVIKEVVLPLGRAFAPDVVVCELGMDALAVAIGTSVTLGTVSGRQVFRLAWHFGFFQFAQLNERLSQKVH